MKKKKTIESCDVAAVGKRRDGGTRYWCLTHGADATAKYGVRAEHCRYAHIPPVEANEVVSIDVGLYEGGVGIWGAVPPVFDTTRLPIDRGIHVHARTHYDGDKDLDRTFRRVRLRVGTKEMEINELDAIYFMVSTVFEKSPQEVICTRCGVSHLDKDWFSVHPHKSHLCSACGKHFLDNKTAVGNPAARAATLLTSRRKPQVSRKSLDLHQRDYPGGIRIWGSNPAVVWTGKKPEVAGIHVHAYTSTSANARREIDDTFASVTVDGIALDPDAVRIHMAQMVLPHLADRIVCARCTKCSRPAFDVGDDAFTPEVGRSCRKCGGALVFTGRYRKVISNPLIGVLTRMSASAVRAPQKHDLGLVPETL